MDHHRVGPLGHHRDAPGGLLMAIYFPRAVSNPRQMPELRVALMQMAVPSGAWANSEFQKLLLDIVGGAEHSTITKSDIDGTTIIAGPKGYGKDEMENMGDIITKASSMADNNVRWYRDVLPEAQLIHIEERMVDFIVAAGDAAPDDLTIHLSDAPCPAGLVVFAKPVWGTDAGPENPGGPVRVDGIIWAPTRLPGRNVKWYQHEDTINDGPNDVLGISIASLRMLEPANDDIPGTKVSQVMWIPLGRTDWPWGDRLDTMLEAAPNPSPNQHASMREDRRLLAALWATINQKRLVDTEIVLPERHAVKRMVKAGYAGQDNRVQIIHLRRSEYRMLDQTDTTGRKLQFRITVK